jgi:transposase-like protein
MAMKWKDLSGEERYRIVELARKGKTPIKEICETFGVSRQTLHRAMALADQAAMEALEPGKPGRKPRPMSEKQVMELAEDKARLDKEIKHWKTRYEIARTILDLEHKAARGEDLPGEKKPRRLKRRKRKIPSARIPGPGGSKETMAETDDGE